MESNNSAKSYKILIADKEFILSFDLTKMLCDLGYEVFYKSDVSEVIQVMQTNQPDFIITAPPTLKELFGKREVLGIARLKGTIAILDARRDKVTCFEPPFLEEAIAKHLADHLKDPD